MKVTDYCFNCIAKNKCTNISKEKTSNSCKESDLLLKELTPNELYKLKQNRVISFLEVILEKNTHLLSVPIRYYIGLIRLLIKDKSREEILINLTKIEEYTELIKKHIADCFNVSQSFAINSVFWSIWRITYYLTKNITNF